MFAVDLKSGYHHVDIHPSCWNYLGFQFEGRSYVFRSLPFGLATAPFVFTQLIKQLARRWRALGVRVIPYVDDIIILRSRICNPPSSCAFWVSNWILSTASSPLVPSGVHRYARPFKKFAWQAEPSARSRSAM
ncbi:unnamed protein product [Closterium sp. NIES-54]